MLYQHPRYRSVTPISVNTLSAEADSHTSTPPVPFSSVSLHIPTSLGAYKNFEAAGWDVRWGLGEAKDSYGSAFVFTSGNPRTLGKIDLRSRLPGGT